MFDFIGDVHGCIDELEELLQTLGYDSNGFHKEGRKAVFVGDYIDRGPSSLGVIKKLINFKNNGNFIGVMGNHDNKFLRFLKGNDVIPTHGMETTLQEYSEVSSEEEKMNIFNFFNTLPYIKVLSEDLMLVHASFPYEHMPKSNEDMLKRCISHCLYGVTNGQIGSNGYVIREDWAKTFHGRFRVVHGHVMTEEPYVMNNVYSIDTGPIMGGKLTAYRFPEEEFIFVKSKKVYYSK